MKIPSFSLPSTDGKAVDPSLLSGLTVIFCYPRTGAPGETITDDWNAIPGARGCTPQACSFRDANAELRGLGVDNIFGASTQDTPYQLEAKERNHLPFQLLSDEKLGMIKTLRLPTFGWKGTTLIKRLSMVTKDGEILKVASSPIVKLGWMRFVLNFRCSFTQYFRQIRAQARSRSG